FKIFQMKKLYILLFLLICGFANAQIVNIPDANFKNALINTDCVDNDGDGSYEDDVDTNNDGEIQVSEAAAVLGLNVSNNYSTPDIEKINSLEGIQNFINLQVLECYNNLLTTIDLTNQSNLKELFCRTNLLSELNVTQNSNLERLDCSENQLTGINLSENPNLIFIQCFY